MKTVLAFGTFDILHPGHLSYLSQARSHGDRLVVVVSRDASVVAAKQAKPLFSERERKAIVSSLSIVDKVVLGSVTNHFSVLSKVRPNVVCLGYDHAVTAVDIRRACKNMGIPCPVVFRARALNQRRFKSSGLKKFLSI
ncbi:adenylyltransferase/cytidyltransferase family protein [Candidatus Uhrbacteria bacterium]|nr:adenylyltransferase/cytidyltransferase family protein [Candidatus Uhrbacteria bacterium]